MEYWCGVARGLGARLYVPRESAILKCNYVYGYVEPPVTGDLLAPLVKFWGDKTEQISKSLDQTRGLLNTVDGARQMSDAVKRLIAEGRTTEQISGTSAVALHNPIVMEFDPPWKHSTATSTGSAWTAQLSAVGGVYVNAQFADWTS